ncbi:ShlB/FhaC/HecB family hemolysin secretion/activation protein [Vibrio sp. HA2012]|uniref:ShlB/FhaC/HecB family hemolysin secretion/activation protein n=1 Tax=Vibrio sp. HA2012 TaxID=1971595 RepID=UPI000C2BD0B8|nr:ShlB/FhaC/HecB family hemolysin secretion/activation protein [Vibrio sp. HA2012]PJC86808.1 ShlB/FhaC/HecB family hemolysin secretion/activation protein [Vibrio sp. HA2012]
MIKWAFQWFGLPVGLMVSSWTVYAAVSPEQLENQKEIFERLEKNQQQDILYFDVETPSLLDTDTKEGERCIFIKEIKEETLTLLSRQEKSAQFTPFVNSCRTITELNNLVKSLSALYVDKGYVTSKVYLKPQTLKNGIVEIQAVEGRVSEILPDESYIKNAFLGQCGDYLNLRDLERSIETINSLPSNHASMKLLPGEKVGATNIQIENNPTRRINGMVALDNYGEKNTGKGQGSLSLNLDNPLGLNDRLSVSLNSTENNYSAENTRGSGIQYSLPVGNRFTLGLKYRKTSYKQLIPAGITDYVSNGETQTYTLNLGYEVFHNKNHRVNIGSFVKHYQAENYISDSLIETSSYNLSKAGGSVDYLYQIPGFYTFTAFTYSKGTYWFNDHNPTELDAQASFYTVDLSLMKAFLGLKYSLNSHYQKAQNALFSTDQISIGGPYSVRGYKKEGLVGNTGYYARHEISKTLETKLFDQVEQTYFVAFDHGHIKSEEDVKGGNLVGSAIGAKYAYKDVNAQLYYAIPLHHKDVTETGNFFGISISYSF